MGRLGSVTFSQSKAALDPALVSISGNIGVGIGGGVDSITKVDVMVLVPSVAVIVWLPPVLAGTSKVAEKVPLAVVIVVATVTGSLR